MYERIISEPPTQYELSATYKKITWDVFSKLTDDQILQLTEESLIEVPQESTEDQTMKRIDEALTLNNFIYWRKFGIPDRQVTAEEIEIRVADYVKQRTEKDQNYGKFPKDVDENLTDHQRRVLLLIFDYFEKTRDLFEYFVIDDYSIYYTLRMTKNDVTFLIDNGFLRKVGDNPLVGGVYELSGQYYDYLLCSLVVKTIEANPKPQ